MVKCNDVNLKFAIEEMINHKRFEHPNIVQFVDCFLLIKEQTIWVIKKLFKNKETDI